jgi:hypothetical protein
VNRAAVERQHAELDGPRCAPAITGGLELAADILRSAAKPLAPSPVASRREMTEAALTSVWAISCVALLLTVPNPAQPLVLAVTLAGTAVLSKLVRDVVVAIWNRRDARRLAAAVNEPEDVQHAIAELRTRIRVITGALEPDRNDLHLEAGRWIESAQVWIDAADHALAETPER